MIPQDKSEEFRQLCRKDFLTFCRAMYPPFEAPRHIQLLAHELENVERRETTRLMITMPPRHGKTMTSSQMFPAWYLGRNPAHSIIMVTYSQSLSNDSGEAVRNMMADPVYQWIFPESTLRPGSKARDRFTTTKGGKGYFVGIGGAVTGRGAHCFPKGTMVATERGDIDIAELHGMHNPPRIWSYNHETKKPELKKLIATRVKTAQELLQLTMESGKILYLTPEHKVFSHDQQQYIAAQNAQETVTQTVILSDMPGALYGNMASQQALQSAMCGQSALRTHEWKQQLQLQAWKRSQGIAKVTEINSAKRQQQMCRVWDAGSALSYHLEGSKAAQNIPGNSPHRSQSFQQCAGKHDYFVQNLSCHSPQIQSDTISQIRTISTSEIPVYDLQIEQNHNFFAAGNLVSNCLLVDDPYKDDEEADSEAIRHRVREFYQGTAYTRLMPGGAVIVIGTRWRHDDLMGWLQDTKEQLKVALWKKFDLPAIAGEERSAWDWREPGEALWPERFPVETLEQIKLEGTGQRKFQAMYQQRPTAQEGNIFKKAYLLEVALQDIENDMISPKIMFLDTAFKEEQHNDYSAAVAACRTRGGDVVILEAMHRRLDFPRLLAWTKTIIQQHEIEALYVEDKASGQSLVQTLKTELSIPIVPIKAETDKVARANAIVPFLEAGRTKFKKPIFPELEQELLTFPFASHDDLVDACVGAITVLTRANFSLSLRRTAGGGLPVSIYGR